MESPADIDGWFKSLTRRLETQKRRAARLRAYTTGDAPLPEMNPELRESWERFQRKAIVNAGALIVDALIERIQINGINVGDDPRSHQAIQARRIMRDTRARVTLRDAMRDAAICGIGYVTVERDDDGTALIRRQPPERYYAAPDPRRPWKARAAIETWRDPDAGEDYAVVTTPDVVAYFTRPALDPNPLRPGDMLTGLEVGQWRLDATEPNPLGDVNVVIFENRGNAGEFEPHTDLIDRLNMMVLWRLTTMAMQAYRQRALVSSADAGAIPTQDSIDELQEAFSAGPGAVWELPPGTTLWESQTTDITAMVAAEKEDLRQLAAVTHTPVSILIPDSANQSATGASMVDQGLAFKAKDRIERWHAAVNVVFVYALRLEGIDLDGQTLEVTFEPPHMVSMGEKYSAASQARAAGEALETIQRNILGYSPEQIADDKQRRAEEQLAFAVGAAAVPQAAPRPGEGTPR